MFWGYGKAPACIFRSEHLPVCVCARLMSAVTLLTGHKTHHGVCVWCPHPSIHSSAKAHQPFAHNANCTTATSFSPRRRTRRGIIKRLHFCGRLGITITIVYVFITLLPKLPHELHFCKLYMSVLVGLLTTLEIRTCSHIVQCSVENVSIVLAREI